MKNVSLTEYLNGKNNLLPNLDPDGVFTYTLINKYIPSDMVGFTNSKNHLYLLEGKNHRGSGITYVDMFVTNPVIQSIDQHIITRTPKETANVASWKTKLNPNILFGTDMTDFKHKFPLSTFLFVLILLSEEYDIKIDWHKKITEDLELGHFLMDIDGVLNILNDYNANVNQWFVKLRNNVSRTYMVDEIYDYINTLPVLELKKISDKVRNYLHDNFNAETKEGGYKTLNMNNVKHISALFNFAKEILFDEKGDIDININNMETWAGTTMVDESQNVNLNETFSYAIVYANGKNFSYTNKLKRL